MKRILFYCQHLLGVGHITRSLALCEALARSFEVDMIQGGPEVGLSLDHPRFRRILLPPLLMREEDSSLYDPADKRTPEDIFAARRLVLDRGLGSYDHFLVDLFPFGRRKFRHELLRLIERLRRDNPAIKVHCSLRDVMVEREREREAETVAWVRSHFDDVLVHSDPNFIRLEDSFGPAAEISDRLVYTGFVAADAPGRNGARRRNTVLVSLGGGVVGSELALACAEAAARLPAYDFHFTIGPHAPDSLKTALARKANVKVVGFLKDFQQALSHAKLSVSLAGYNTVMDLLRTRTYGLVLPYGANREQTMRARRFEQAGLLKIIPGTNGLEALLREALEQPYPDVKVDLAGAEKTRDYLRASGACLPIRQRANRQGENVQGCGLVDRLTSPRSESDEALSPCDSRQRIARHAPEARKNPLDGPA